MKDTSKLSIRSLDKPGHESSTIDEDRSYYSDHYWDDYWDNSAYGAPASMEEYAALKLLTVLSRFNIDHAQVLIDENGW